MSLFTSLRRQHLSSTDEKDHDSDSEEALSLMSPSSNPSPLFSDGNNHHQNNNGNNELLFSLRIKLNDGTSPNNSCDFVLENVSPGVTTVRVLKERILKKHSSTTSGENATNDSTNNNNNNNRYLRLIVRGRMMAPDTSTLDKFSITKDDVIHAILAKEGTRGGQQARMLRRLNKNSSSSVVTTDYSSTGGNNSGGGSGLLARGATTTSTTTSTSVPSGGGGSLSNRLLRRIGIDSNGIVISSIGSNDTAEDDTDDDESDDDESDDEAEGGGDVEMGNISRRRRGQRDRRRTRERRGFDRLRVTGMSREEVTAIRLYFARSVDRYIERRRVMIRAARQMRDGTNNSEGGDGISVPLGSGDENNSTSYATATTSTTPNTSNNSSNNNDDEEILTDRRRMEDEWMSTQGPYSEFRLNLNTSNPLLLAAISGGAASASQDATATMRLNAAMGMNGNGGGRGGLFFRRAAAAVNAAAVALEVDDDEEGEGGEEDDEDDLMFGGTLNPNGTYVPRTGIHPMYMGPLPSAGTEKDFVWGFILGFFVGFIMLFWVWMPTVTHKQKVGIILGICFQLGMNLILKNNVQTHI